MDIRPYWWKGHLNFGDRLNGYLLMQMGVNPHWHKPADANFVMVGSILEHLPRNWKGTVAGAGLLKPESHAYLHDANVVALRGRLTANRTFGLRSRDVALGDPGLLVPKFHSPNTAKIDLGVIPHWSDTELYEKYSYGHLIDVTQHPDKVIQEISRCKRIVSSSLHGIVVADAFGIPRQAELFKQAEKEGGAFKFFDYASVYEDCNPHLGEMYRAPHAEVERIQRRLHDALNGVLHFADSTCFADPEPFRWRCPFNKPQISVLMPFRDDGENRTRVFNWLRSYWESQLPSVEIVRGFDGHSPFSKAAAVNDAARKARGRIFVIMDADAYMDAQTIQACADRIDHAVRHHKRLWYMPYDKLYRLNRHVTSQLLHTTPQQPYQIPSPPPEDWLDGPSNADYGHQYGALAQVMPAEAFFIAGGWDARFRGWGGEDASFLRALDTLYAPHHIVHGDISHLWHVRPGVDFKTRRWVGQQANGPANSRLASRYGLANGEPAYMQGLIEERGNPTPRQAWMLWRD